MRHIGFLLAVMVLLPVQVGFAADRPPNILVMMAGCTSTQFDRKVHYPENVDLDWGAILLAEESSFHGEDDFSELG